MLDSEGSVKTARQGIDAVKADDRKVDPIVCELCRYDMTVAALQETKWFRKAVYQVGESYVLAASRPVEMRVESEWRGSSHNTVWYSYPGVENSRERVKSLEYQICISMPTDRQTNRQDENRLHSSTYMLYSGLRIPSDMLYILLGDLIAHMGSWDDTFVPRDGV